MIGPKTPKTVKPDNSVPEVIHLFGLPPGEMLLKVPLYFAGLRQEPIGG